MGKTSIPNKLNHKLQDHARVCKENKEKNDCQLKYFVVKGSTLEDCSRTVTLLIKTNLLQRFFSTLKY